jgi:hypothetical protein
VYHSTYSGNYAYLEIYCKPTTDKTISITTSCFGGTGWNLLTTPEKVDTTVPSGYSSKTINLTNGAIMADSLYLSGSATVNSNLTVIGATTLGASGTAATTTKLTVNGQTVLSGNVSISGTLGVTGATTLSSTLGVTGITTLNNKLIIKESSGYEGGSFYTTASTSTGSISTNLIIGNDTASGAKGNRYGILQIYSEGASCISLRAHRYASNGTTAAASSTIYLRDHGTTAYLVATTTRSAVGSSTIPVYVNTNGVITACSSYAGGTAITLNGTSKAASTASFYAPTSSGTAGYILKSGGANVAPSWI